MDNLFYLVGALIALALLILIARSLATMDRRDRERRDLQAGPPETPATPAIPERPIAPPVVRDIPTDLLREEEPPASEQREPVAHEEAPPELPRMEPEQPEPVQFSAYYPKEVTPDSWQPLLAYAFRERAAAAVNGDAGERLGPRRNDYRETGDAARQPIAEGAVITATPRLEGFQFNPPSVALGFFEDWHRFEFKLRATTTPLNQAGNGQLTFTIEGVIVADIPLSIFVGESVTASSTASASRKAYDAIFCSYSRKDMEIVQRVERAYTILGLEYLRDMLSIRSGEDWSDALEKLIERADIFQLFWSSASASSKHVEMEWQYALKLPNKPDNFIRPVYWEQPMPPVPDALQRLHFAFDDTLDDE